MDMALMIEEPVWLVLTSPEDEANNDDENEE